MKNTIRLALLLLGAACAVGRAQEAVDPDFDVTVKTKTYAAKEHPRVLIDEAHHNLYTAADRYKPLAQLLTNDGYDVQPNTEKFQPQTLRAAQVLIISNARGEGATEDSSPPAFTDAEKDIIRDWVSDGGALLLIADSRPFGDAAAGLARQFGVSMGKGFAFDPASAESAPTLIAFGASQLGDHPISRGRTSAEKLKRVVAFEGQTLSVPGIATALLKFAPTVYEAESPSELALALDAVRGQGAAPKRVPHATPAVGRAQAAALKFGKGRVVIAGEAALFSAQIQKSPAGPETKVGMNTPGNDDRQFVLNVLHWLSSAL